jgi:hypothetical protein
MFDMNGFRSQVNSSGWAVQNYYDIYIPTMQLAQASTSIYNAQAAILQFSDDAWDWMADYFESDPAAMGIELQAYCQQTELPSYQFQMETNRSYGPAYKIPHRPEYQDLTMTFMCGNQMLERWFFDAWMYMVMDPDTNNFNYIDEYACDVTITQYQDFAGPATIASAFNNAIGGPPGSGLAMPNYYTTLIDAFPISIAQQPLAYANNNVFQTIQVTFTYKYASAWTNGTTNAGNRTIRSANGQQNQFTNTVLPPAAPAPAP